MTTRVAHVLTTSRPNEGDDFTLFLNRANDLSVARITCKPRAVVASVDDSLHTPILFYFCFQRTLLWKRVTGI